MIIHYQTCKAEYHLLSRQCITPVSATLMQYLALTTRDILPCMLDNVMICVHVVFDMQVSSVQDASMVKVVPTPENGPPELVALVKKKVYT